jgi:hypothetical protein
MAATAKQPAYISTTRVIDRVIGFAAVIAVLAHGEEPGRG